MPDPAAAASLADDPLHVLTRRLAVPLGYPLDDVDGALARSLASHEARVEVLARIARRAKRLGARVIDATMIDGALVIAMDLPDDAVVPAPGILERSIEQAFGVPVVWQRDDNVSFSAPSDEAPAASAAATLALSWLERIRSMQAECVRGIDPEGPHQIRVSVRRLRTTLRMLDRLPGVTGLAPVVVRVRALGDLAGAVRDHDVVIERVKALECGDTDAIQSALRHLERRRLRALERLRRVFLSPNTKTAIEHLRTALEVAKAAPDDTRLDDASRDLLDRSFRQLRRQSRQGLTDGEAYHALRRRIRRVRDAIDVFGPALKKNDHAWRKRLQPVQALLGSLNDIETAMMLVPATLVRAAPVRRALERQRLDKLAELAVPLLLTVLMARDR